MGKLVVFRFLDCKLDKPSQFTVEIGEEGKPAEVQWTDILPPCSDIYQDYCDLRETLEGLEAYRSLNSSRALVRTPQPNLQFSDKELAARVSQGINNLLERCKISLKIREQLQLGEEIRVVIETDNFDLQKLPWHCWNFFGSYQQAEITLSLAEYHNIQANASPKKNVKIIAILGDATGINLEQDKFYLESFTKGEIDYLKNPEPKQIFDQLRDKSYDILFFAGHSYSRNKTGDIQLNQNIWLPISELREAVNQSIKNGLRLAIFNSCDGLGLAQDLLILNNSSLTTILMREPIPDKVAHEFLKYFLKEFVSKTPIPIYVAVRKARQRLKESLENEYPCASWLPAIFQNKAQPTLTWQDFLIDEKQRSTFFEFLFSIGLTGFEGGLIAIALSSWLGTSLITNGFWIFWGMLILGWLIFAKFHHKLTKIVLLIIALVTLTIILLFSSFSVAVIPKLTVVQIALLISGLAVMFASTFWLIYRIIKIFISNSFS
jgi:hypothetical protein